MKQIKKVTIISYYKWWNIRYQYFAVWFTQHGYDVTYLTADFDHISKTVDGGEVLPSCGIKVKVPTYNRNLSFKRIYSNIVFAYKVEKIIMSDPAGVIICLIPSNILGLVLQHYKKNYKNSIIIIDVLDLWPESLPFTKIKKLFSFPFKIWKNFRKRGFNAASCVICECDLFLKVLSYEIPDNKGHVLYLQKSEKQIVNNKQLSNTLKMAYLGSINNIVDIKGIVDLLALVNSKRHVELVIIGCGSNEELFVNSAKARGIDVIFYGSIFDENRKQDILSSCHFGLNMMKSSVMVGLTTKSIDYLKFGLPLINSISADTEYLVDKYRAGFNIRKIGMNKVADILINLNIQQYNKLTNGVINLFTEKFSTLEFEKKLNKILNEIVVQGANI